MRIHFHTRPHTYYAPDDETGQNAPTPHDSTITGEQLESMAAEMFKSDIAASVADVTPEDDDKPDDPALPDSTGGQADADDGAADGGEAVVEGVTSPPDADDEPTPGDQLAEDLIALGDDVTLTKAEAREWAQFGMFLRANPDKAEQIAAVLQGQPQADLTPPPAPTPQAPVPAPQSVNQPPEGLDLEDPAVRILWEQHVATQTQLAELSQRTQSHEAMLAQQQMQQTEALLNTAVAAYATQHNLTEPEMTKIKGVTERLQVLPALLSPFDPMTGAPRQVDPVSAIQEGFDMARWSIPEFREREMQARAEVTKTDNKRKKKLSSLGGSSGTSPREPQIPNTPAGRRSAMIAEVAGLMEGSQ